MTLHLGGTGRTCRVIGVRTGHAGWVLRLLRDPAILRVVAVAVVVGLVAVSAPVLLPLVRWLVGLL